MDVAMAASTAMTITWPEVVRTGGTRPVARCSSRMRGQMKTALHSPTLWDKSSDLPGLHRLQCCRFVEILAQLEGIWNLNGYSTVQCIR